MFFPETLSLIGSFLCDVGGSCVIFSGVLNLRWKWQRSDTGCGVEHPVSPPSQTALLYRCAGGKVPVLHRRTVGEERKQPPKSPSLCR